MKIIAIPAVNGLGKTPGAVEGSKKLAKVFEGVSSLKIGTNLIEQIKNIEAETKKIIESGEKPLYIGGDHSISYPCAKAFVDTYNEKAKIIIFDAHADCMPPMAEPTHEEWLAALIEQTELSGENVLLIGARKIEPEEQLFIEKHRIKTLTVEEIRYDLAKSLRKVNRFIAEGTLYLSFDVDVFDDSLIKATGYPEPHGLNEKEIEILLNQILKKEIGAADVVELHADKKSFEQEAQLIKEIIKKIADSSD